MTWIDLKEELLVLSSVYCGDRELVVYPECSGDHPSFPVKLTLTIPVQECAPVITLVIELTILDSYPTTPPTIKLSSSHFDTACLTRHEQITRDYASSLVPQPSLLNVITHVRETVQDDITSNSAALSDHSSVAELFSRGQTCYESSTQTTATLSTVSPSLTTSSTSPMNCSLVKIDHMRSETHYLRLLRKWADDLNVFCRVANAGPHRIFTLLKGTKEDVSDFLKRWKTSPVDVDKRGRPCKEKLLTILYQGIANQPLTKG